MRLFVSMKSQEVRFDPRPAPRVFKGERQQVGGRPGQVFVVWNDYQPDVLQATDSKSLFTIFGWLFDERGMLVRLAPEWDLILDRSDVGDRKVPVREQNLETALLFFLVSRLVGP